MDLSIGAKIGEGGFSDVYEGIDINLNRKVAVKIVRASAAVLSSALEHARALVRAQHPNVVSVIALEKVQHPDSGELVDAIVMEHLCGEHLAERLRRSHFTSLEVAGVARGLVAGLRHIHSTGLTHGDLHAENVMIDGGKVKIIDILYRDSLALLSRASKETLLRKDLLNLRLLIYDILQTSELNPAFATEFNQRLDVNSTIDDIEQALQAALDPARGQDQDFFIEHVLGRIRDEGFVEGDEYARALAAETPNEITEPLLIQLLTEGAVLAKHRQYISLLWERLSDRAKRDLGRVLARVLDQEVPRGRWGTPVNILEGCGREGWFMLPPVTRLRLEAAIVNDILGGQHDIYKENPGGPGTLGTYTNLFWEYFTNRDRLLDNLVAKLKTNWNGQNYVGKYLMFVLTRIADTPARRSRAIEALGYAFRNDSKMVVQNLDMLPSDWREEVTCPF